MEKVDIKETGLYKFVVVLSSMIGFAGVFGFFVFVEDAEAWIALAFLVGAVVAILLLLGYFIIAKYFYQAAVDKGYSDTYYLNLAFFFPFAGYALVNALPDRGNYTHTDAVRPQSIKSVLPPNPAPVPSTKAQATKTEQITSSIVKDTLPKTPEVQKTPEAPKESCPHCGEDIEFMGFSNDDIENGTALCPFCNKAISHRRS